MILHIGKRTYRMCTIFRKFLYRVPLALLTSMRFGFFFLFFLTEEYIFRSLFVKNYIRRVKHTLNKYHRDSSPMSILQRLPRSVGLSSVKLYLQSDKNRLLFLLISLSTRTCGGHTLVVVVRYLSHHTLYARAPSAVSPGSRLLRTALRKYRRPADIAPRSNLFYNQCSL